MATDPIDKSLWHPNPLRHPLEDRRNAAGIQGPTDLGTPDQSTKYRYLADLRMFQPHPEPPHRLAREVGQPSLPFRIGLSAPDQRSPCAIRVEVDVTHL